jgi:hypothetical protein
MLVTTFIGVPEGIIDKVKKALIKSRVNRRKVHEYKKRN